MKKFWCNITSGVKKFWCKVITSGVFHYVAGFYFVGVLLCSFKTLCTFPILLYTFLIIFNIGLGTRNFINFYKREEGLRDQLEAEVRFHNEARVHLEVRLHNESEARLRHCRTCVWNPTVENRAPEREIQIPLKPETPPEEKKIVRRLFGGYRKLLLVR